MWWWHSCPLSPLHPLSFAQKDQICLLVLAKTDKYMEPFCPTKYCMFCPIFIMHTVFFTPVWANVPPLVSWYWHPRLVHINYVILMDISVIVFMCFKNVSAAYVFCSSSILVADVLGNCLLQDFVSTWTLHPLTLFIKTKTNPLFACHKLEFFRSD